MPRSRREGGKVVRAGLWSQGAALIAAMLLQGEAGARQARPGAGTAHEADADMPPLRVWPRSTTRRHVATFGAFTHIQANLDGSGSNVVADAANEPSIAVDPTAPNRMAIGWRQFETIESSFREAGYSYSRDGGRTWSALSVIDPGVQRSDPVLAASPDGTFFYYLSLHVANGIFECDLFISDDGGVTWPQVSPALGGDKSWIALDRTTGPGAGNVYQAWNTAGNQYFPDQFSRSLDRGFSWGAPIEYTPGSRDPARPVFGILDVGPEGEVYVAGAQNSSDTEIFWVVRSTNAENPLLTPTFDVVTLVDMGGNFRSGIGPNPSGLLGQVYVRVSATPGPSYGDVYVLCPVDPPGDDPMDIHFIRSTDGGLSWSAPIRVNTDPMVPGAWQWFGTMSVAPNGRIDVVWNDTRSSLQANLSQLYYSSSSDGGQTWSPDIAISEPFDTHVGWPVQQKIGDYYDMVSDDVGAHVIWAATFNGEQDLYYTRIGDYDCNSNGVGDIEDIAKGSSDDCDGNMIPDACELAANPEVDVDGNGVIDACECPDANGDGQVDVQDLSAVILAWGQCPPSCPADFNDDGVVNVQDLTAVVIAWGGCG